MVEVEMRIRDAQQAFDHYKAYWSKPTNLEIKRIIFKNMVFSTLISGMVSLNMTSSDVMRLHAKMMALARRCLAGRATIKDEQAAHIVKKPEAEILKMMKLGTFQVEVNISRLQFWQRIFKAPDYHQQLITAMYGRFPFDEDIEDYMKSSRYVEFKKCLDIMQHFDSLYDLWQDLGDPQQLLFDEELRDRFTQADFKVMRVALWTAAIPPSTLWLMEKSLMRKMTITLEHSNVS